MKEKNVIKKEIAERLKLARELSGLSQSQAAKFLQVSRPTISEIESGKRNVSSTEILQFSHLYAVDASWILGNDKDSQDFATSKLQLAARELSKLSEDEMHRLFKLLSAMKKK